MCYCSLLIDLGIFFTARPFPGTKIFRNISHAIPRIGGSWSNFKFRCKYRIQELYVIWCPPLTDLFIHCSKMRINPHMDLHNRKCFFVQFWLCFSLFSRSRFSWQEKRKHRITCNTPLQIAHLSWKSIAKKHYSECMYCEVWRPLLIDFYINCSKMRKFPHRDLTLQDIHFWMCVSLIPSSHFSRQENMWYRITYSTPFEIAYLS